MKQIDFDTWFEAQYGSLPRPMDCLRLAEKVKHLKTDLADAEGRLLRLDEIQSAYTAALYSCQAFGLNKRRRQKRGGK